MGGGGWVGRGVRGEGRGGASVTREGRGGKGVAPNALSLPGDNSMATQPIVAYNPACGTLRHSLPHRVIMAI